MYQLFLKTHEYWLLTVGSPSDWVTIWIKAACSKMTTLRWLSSEKWEKQTRREINSEFHFQLRFFCNTTIFWSDSVPLSEDYFAFLKATISDLDGISVSKEALGAEAGGGRGVVEIALNRDKGLLSVIQHQPFYSSYSMHIWAWASPGVDKTMKRVSKSLCRRYPRKECQRDWTVSEAQG